MEKAADTQASASATTNAASLTGVIECRATAARGTTVTPKASVTVGVTGAVTTISSALRRIRPAFCHALNRRPARIRFQPHCRASSVALALTCPSGRERSLTSASMSSNGRDGVIPVMMRSCSLNIGGCVRRIFAWLGRWPRIAG